MEWENWKKSKYVVVYSFLVDIQPPCQNRLSVEHDGWMRMLIYILYIIYIYMVYRLDIMHH